MTDDREKKMVQDAVEKLPPLPPMEKRSDGAPDDVTATVMREVLGVKHRPDVEYQVCVRRWGTHEGEYDEVCTDARVDEQSEHHSAFVHNLAAEFFTCINNMQRFRKIPR